MSVTADFLVEIGTEELPPKSLAALEQAFAGYIQEALGAAGLGYTGFSSFATPRRLAVLVSDLQCEQPRQKVEKRGPPVAVAFAADGSPTRAAAAFAEGCGVPVEALGRLETAKGAWLFHSAESAGQPASGLLPGIVNAALAALPIPRRMRWGSSDVEFVRPVHWVVMLLGDAVLPAPVLGIAPGRETRGHRFHAQDALSLAKPADYPAVLASRGKVIPEFSVRRDRVRQLADAAARAAGGVAIYSDELLDEVTALVEWPVAITGSFDPEFLRLPEEVVIATLQGHQRYFPVRDPGGHLMPRFITTANLESREPDQVRQGNERVILPRLSDAAFFWDQDRKMSLSSRVDRLATIVFQHGLGSVLDRSQRVATLAGEIAESLGHDRAAVERAGLLAKADLLTQMVGEFPELQGRMGCHYATHDGEPAAVATAIEEQYLPRHAGDRLPATPAGRALAIADRADLLAGVFALRKLPTGNKDPFGLRRAALGLLRILVEDGVDLDLPALLARAIALQPVAAKSASALTEELYDFIVERSRAWYLDGLAPGVPAGSVTAETFEAVRLRRPTSPVDFHARLMAVHSFMGLPEAESLSVANKRIANILRTAGTGGNGVDPAAFEAAEERALHTAIEKVIKTHRQHLASRDYRQALQGLATLESPVDAFFKAVMVMADDTALRNNRLAQLRRLRELFLDVADLSCLSTTSI
ncbi:MAG: glycine--tRNA ligase subunit beta [Gammaproteobacteria bacterium]|nr:glycine--tRNA ligase subunit beta [Gammaproteobacteria bacterium]MDH5275925.1 glycine--tRNA ligase subunit beta [Gammaproteobacteria bacterium]